MRAEDYLDRMNWANDPRNCPDKTKTPTLYLPDDEEMVLPTRWGVCPVCEGEGKHVNPSIDCGGLSLEDFDEDPDFEEDYFGGFYDVTCNCCQGLRVVRVVDKDQLTLEQLKLWERQLQEEAEDRAIARAEFIRGC